MGNTHVASAAQSRPPTISFEKPEFAAPVPQRAKISPILQFQTPVTSNFGATGQSNVTTSAPAPDSIILPQPKVEFPVSFRFTAPSPAPSPTVPTEAKAENLNLLSTKPSLRFEDKVDSAKRDLQRQSVFERQEKLLQDELSRQERERQLKVKSEEQETQKSREMALQRTIERQAMREREAAALEKEKAASKENEERQRALKEKRKAEREKAVDFFAHEIVNSIVREHILEVNATMLAVAFYRKHLLSRVLRLLKKICVRSVRRKELYLEEIAQSRKRRTLLTRALAELESGRHSSVAKKPRRGSFRADPLESEEYLEDILIKVSNFLSGILL